jgi:5-methyltetrahydropteroyltriglutamate--homocysteine methyltransferase
LQRRSIDCRSSCVLNCSFRRGERPRGIWGGDAIKRSTDRILTTHVGSLIRPAALREFLAAKEAGQPFDADAYARCLKDCVAEVVRQQADIGIDVVSDGEFGKAISWAQYALFRLGGFERRPFKASANPFTRGADRTRFAEFYADLDSRDKVETVMDSVAVAPITYTGQAELTQDIDNLKAALRSEKVAEAFLPVAAPASVIPDRKNEHYASDEELQQAIGAAMRTEYRMIIDAGFLVQLDDARAAVSYDRTVPPKTLKEYRAWLAKQVEITNHAIEGLPREKIRYHVCWGSWPGPHASDVPFKDIADSHFGGTAERTQPAFRQRIQRAKATTQIHLSRRRAYSCAVGGSCVSGQLIHVNGAQHMS